MANGTAANVTLGAGTLYVAPLASAEPVDLASPWDAAWRKVGYTEAGHTFDSALTVQDVLVAEELDPIKQATVSRKTSIKFALAEVTAKNLKLALNGGTTTAGSGIVTYVPGSVGTEVRTMIGWQSLDGLERLVCRQCIQSGGIAVKRAKAPAIASFTCDFGLEIPVNGSNPGGNFEIFKQIFDSTRA